jgi:hypothetical protein
LFVRDDGRDRAIHSAGDFCFERFFQDSDGLAILVSSKRCRKDLL